MNTTKSEQRWPGTSPTLKTAYISSLSSSGLGSSSATYLQDAISYYNNLDLEPDALNVDSFLKTVCSPMTLSGKIEKCQFSELYDSVSPADKARLLSVSSTHPCLCLVISCIIFVNEHNRLRDILLESCHRACLSPKMEAGCGLGHEGHCTLGIKSTRCSRVKPKG